MAGADVAGAAGFHSACSGAARCFAFAAAFVLRVLLSTFPAVQYVTAGVWFAAANTVDSILALPCRCLFIGVQALLVFGRVYSSAITPLVKFVGQYPPLSTINKMATSAYKSLQGCADVIADALVASPVLTSFKSGIWNTVEALHVWMPGLVGEPAWYQQLPGHVAKPLLAACLGFAAGLLTNLVGFVIMFALVCSIPLALFTCVFVIPSLGFLALVSVCVAAPSIFCVSVVYYALEPAHQKMYVWGRWVVAWVSRSVSTTAKFAQECMEKFNEPGGGMSGIDAGC